MVFSRWLFQRIKGRWPSAFGTKPVSALET